MLLDMSETHAPAAQCNDLIINILADLMLTLLDNLRLECGIAVARGKNLEAPPEGSRFFL
jgi:hypothetical protein